MVETSVILSRTMPSILNDNIINSDRELARTHTIKISHRGVSRDLKNHHCWSKNRENSEKSKQNRSKIVQNRPFKQFYQKYVLLVEFSVFFQISIGELYLFFVRENVKL